MYFNIKHKKTGNEKNFTLDEFLTFIGKNVIYDYDVFEKDGNPNERKHREKLFTSGSKELAEFHSTMTFAQKNDVATGYKEISFNSEIGYYLKVLKERTEIYVPTITKKQRSVSTLLNEMRSLNEKTEFGKLAIIANCHEILSLLQPDVNNVCRNSTVTIVDDLEHPNYGSC